jgi:hypothetical protein
MGASTGKGGDFLARIKETIREGGRKPETYL